MVPHMVDERASSPLAVSLQTRIWRSKTSRLEGMIDKERWTLGKWKERAGKTMGTCPKFKRMSHAHCNS